MSERIVKIGGVAGLAAAALFIASLALVRLTEARTFYTSPADYLGQTVALVAFLAVVVVILALGSVRSRTGRLGRLTLVGAWLAGLGYAGIAAVSAYNLVRGGWSLVGVRMGVATVLLVGSAILGIAVLATRLAPWWCGVLLIIAFPLGDVANEVFSGSEVLLLSLLWGSIGVALLRRATVPAAQSSVTPAHID